MASVAALEDTDDEEREDESAPAGPAWSDAELGTFHFDDFGWVIRLALPAFDIYTKGARKSQKNRQYPLTIVSNSDQELPVPEAITLVKELIANQAVLAARTAEGLWADFTGAGPESGMYWHGDLDQVAEGLDSGEPPRSAKDLYKLIRLGSVRVLKVGKAQSYLSYDGELFRGHSIGVWVAPDGTVERAVMGG